MTLKVTPYRLSIMIYLYLEEFIYLVKGQCIKRKNLLHVVPEHCVARGMYKRLLLVVIGSFFAW